MKKIYCILPADIETKQVIKCLLIWRYPATEIIFQNQLIWIKLIIIVQLTLQLMSVGIITQSKKWYISQNFCFGTKTAQKNNQIRHFKIINTCLSGLLICVFSNNRIPYSPQTILEPAHVAGFLFSAP